MPSTLPVPIEFVLPDGWRPAAPDKVEELDVAFVALHPEGDASFTPNITIDGEYRPDTASLAAIADESVERMHHVAETVTLTARKEVGSGRAPGLMQELAFSAAPGGVRCDLVQTQVYLSMLDTEDERKRVVVRLALTATVHQYAPLSADFQDLVRTVRPDTPAASPS